MSNFDYAGRLTETVLLGVVALKAGAKIEWDAAAMKAKNCPDADQYIRRLPQGLLDPLRPDRTMGIGQSRSGRGSACRRYRPVRVRSPGPPGWPRSRDSAFETATRATISASDPAMRALDNRSSL